MSRARSGGTAEMLEGVFFQALLLALGAQSLAGCGNAEGIEQEPGFVAAPCDSKGEAIYLGGLEPAPPADGMLLTMEHPDLPIQILEQVGTPCAGATDTHACQIALMQSSLLNFVLGTGGQLPVRAQLRATQGGGGPDPHLLRPAERVSGAGEHAGGGGPDGVSGLWCALRAQR
jgi:hypothetical protein